MPTLEELQQQLLETQEKLKASETKNNELTTKNKELAQQNENLIEHNNKLFTRLTAQQDAEQSQPKPQINEDEQFEADVKKLLKIEEEN